VTHDRLLHGGGGRRSAPDSALFKECFHLSEVQRAVARVATERRRRPLLISTAIFGRYAPSYGVALRFTSRAIVLGCCAVPPRSVAT